VRIRPKVFLLIAILTGAGYLVDGLDDLGGGVLLPLAAVFFIAFFIDIFIGREVALFDQEQRAGPPGRIRDSGRPV
jgi:hypothetical protein